MEATQDRSRDNILGWHTSRGREPAGSQWRLHPKPTMGLAMVIANVLVKNTLAVERVSHNHVVEAIVA
jgi:hypothetical protein